MIISFSLQSDVFIKGCDDLYFAADLFEVLEHSSAGLVRDGALALDVEVVLPVGFLCGAQNAVRSGLVELDFEPEERVDKILVAPATISVRGFGRFILRSFDGETKKGRLRMRADQLV